MKGRDFFSFASPRFLVFDSALAATRPCMKFSKLLEEYTLPEWKGPGEPSHANSHRGESKASVSMAGGRGCSIFLRFELRLSTCVIICMYRHFLLPLLTCIGGPGDAFEWCARICMVNGMEWCVLALARNFCWLHDSGQQVA